MSKKDAALNISKLILRKMRKCVGTIRRKWHYYHLWPYYYKKYSKEPIDEKKIVFAYNSRYKTMPDNLKVVKDYLEERGYNCIVIPHTDCENKTSSPLKNFFLNFFFDCKDFFQAYGNCRALFLIDYYFPAFACKPREGQSVVQLWHACGAFKMWGYSTVDKAWGVTKTDLDRYPIHNTYTHVCVSSPKVSFAYNDALHCGMENIYPLGSPRTDVYFDPEFVAQGRSCLKEMFPEIGDKKIILYAPTFRGNSLRKSYMRNTLDFEKLYNALHEDYVFVMKLHPLTAKAFKIKKSDAERYDGFLYDISQTVQIDTALCAADVVISDYSSLIFEYALLGRPMIFYAYDLENYDRTRSFYFDYRTFVPGEIVVDTDEIVNEVKRLETDFDKERVAKFRDDFMSACDGNSTKRIIEAVLGISE